jgi:PAS domain S-box-containing protein
MENNLLLLKLFGNDNAQIKKNRVLQLISISLLTLSIILAFKFFVLLIFPGLSYEYYEMTIIIGSCLAVNISASIILYRYQLLLQQLEDRLELKTDNLHSVIKNLRQEREDCRLIAAGLQQSEEKYQALMEHVSDGILLLDEAGNLLQANQKLQKLLGFSETELLSKTLKQIVPQEERQRTASALEIATQTGAADLADSWIIGRDHQKIPVALACQKLDCAGKTVIQGVFTFRELPKPRPAAMNS